MKKILVICGAGIATSTLVKSKIEDFLKEKNLKAEVKTSTIASSSSHLSWADLIVTTTKYKAQTDIPVIKAVCLLGIGDTESFFHELESYLI